METKNEFDMATESSIDKFRRVELNNKLADVGRKKIIKDCFRNPEWLVGYELGSLEEYASEAVYTDSVPRSLSVDDVIEIARDKLEADYEKYKALRRKTKTQGEGE